MYLSQIPGGIMRPLHTLRLSIATILVVSTALLAACSAPAVPTDEPTTEEAAEPTEAPQEESEATEAPATEAAGQGEPVTLVYWSMWHEDEPQGQVVQKAIDDLEAANSNVTVEVVWNGRDN